MFKDFGGVFGWVMIIAITGTMLNYGLKLVNKHFGKKISAYPAGQKLMKALMTIFVRNHKCFGFTAALLLLAHFMIQFSTFGLNVSGGVAALLLVVQVGLGIYGIVKKRPRRGAWFIAHRIIAVLLISGIALHLIAPYALNVPVKNEPSGQVSASISDSELQTFTLDELSKYNGENGNKAYVAYKGLVYDIAGNPKWSNGKHNGNIAGTDLTEAIKRSPHGDSKITALEVVGKLQ